MPHLDLEDGFRLYYERHGEGPPVVFAHGAGGNALSWWQQVPAFAERHTVVTFDHRAFGRSPDIEDGPGRTAFGSDALALLDALGLGPVHFVAHSMGARTAIGLMRLDPDRFRSLTISGSNAGCVDDRLRERKAELQASGALDGTLLQRALPQDFAEREPELALLYRHVRSINPPRPRDFLAPSPQLRNYRGSTAGRLLDAGVPLLWIVGEQDRVVPAELVRISHEITPGSRYVEILDAGHSAYFERASAWNAEVLGFVEVIEAQER
jgi:pimeloyl-ACP methyl ester carboxylesterase